METTDYGLSLIMSVVAVPLTSWLKARDWPTWAKMVALLVVSMVLALVQLFIQSIGQHQFNWTQFVANIPTIFTLASFIYETYFKNTPLNRDLESQGPWEG